MTTVYLYLDKKGKGSYKELRKYVEQVLTENFVPVPEKNVGTHNPYERRAKNIVDSILSRLDFETNNEDPVNNMSMNAFEKNLPEVTPEEAMKYGDKVVAFLPPLGDGEYYEIVKLTAGLAVVKHQRVVRG